MAKNLLQNSCDLVPVTPLAATAQVSSPQGLVLIQKQTVVGVTSVSFIGLAQYPYSNYKLYTNIASTTGTGPLILQLSTNNGSSYITTSYTSGSTILQFNGGGVSAGGSSTAGMIVVTSGVWGYNSINCTLDISHINDSSNYVNSVCFGNALGSAVQNYTLFGTGGYFTLITANAFKIILTGGQAFSGTFSLYGYQ